MTTTPCPRKGCNGSRTDRFPALNVPMVACPLTPTDSLYLMPVGAVVDGCPLLGGAPEPDEMVAVKVWELEVAWSPEEGQVNIETDHRNHATLITYGPLDLPDSPIRAAFHALRDDEP